MRVLQVMTQVQTRTASQLYTPPVERVPQSQHNVGERVTMAMQTMNDGSRSGETVRRPTIAR